MTSLYKYVVGDKFTEFAKNPFVMQISDLERILDDEALTADCPSIRLGQGVSQDRANALIGKAEALGLRDRLDFDPIDKCGSELCHKQDLRNSLLSFPRRVSEDTFEADLHVDDEGELMSDHQSGQHLQGMILVEALRQMILAVTEEYYLRHRDKPSAFLWSGIALSFRSFVLPIPAKVRYVIVSSRGQHNRRLSFEVAMDIIQGPASCCTATSSLTVLDKRVVDSRETALVATAPVVLI